MRGLVFLVIAAAVGCTQDFDQFMPVGDAAAKDSASDSGGDAAPCSKINDPCATTATSCASACGNKSTTCVATCGGSPPCVKQCQTDEATCRTKCMQSCITCATGGCDPTNACKSLAGL